MTRLTLALLVLTAAQVQAASRARYGGMLRVAVASPLPGADPLLADTPMEAALLGLTERGVCRLDRWQRPVPVLALEMGRTAPGQLHIALRPFLRASAGAPVAAQELAASWMRLSGAATASPYRALLFPLRGEGKSLGGAVASQYALDTALAFPWPDLEKSLCHPALALALPGPKGLSGVGPFAPTHAPGVFVLNLHAPEGRPYVDRLSVLATDERGATRAFAELKQVDLALGAQGGASTGPALFATYLAFRPERLPDTFRQSVEAAIDRADLTRFFVRAPAVPMSRLLPPSLMPNDVPPTPGPPTPASRDLTLAYDSALEDQKLVAERIQVRLHDLGYRIQLKAVPRAVLRAKWASGDFDAMLHAVLLPPTPAPAFAVALDLAGRHDLLATELPPLGAISDAAARDAKTRERALAVGPTLPLIPLYAQGLAAESAGRVEGLSVDAFGLPTLDDVFLSE